MEICCSFLQGSQGSLTEKVTDEKGLGGDEGGRVCVQ